MSSSDKIILDRLDDLEKLMVGALVSPWMTQVEAARYLRCGKRKIEQLTASDRLPYFRLDPSLNQSPKLIHRKHLAAYLITSKNSMDQRLTSAERKMVDELL